jgi:putative DNA primase/helicase
MELQNLIQTGLALLPVPIGKKNPSAKAWNMRQNTVIEVTELSRLANKNIGLAHAYCTPTPTCAIDIDDYKQAKKWLRGHGIDLKSMLFAGDAVVIWSGKRNSIKLLYRLPPETDALSTTQVRSTDQTMMLEFRCASRDGSTMQDLIPPSLHPSGSSYRWMGQGSPAQIPCFPARLLALWLEQGHKPHGVDTTARATIYSQRPETPRAVAHVTAMLTFISANCDYVTWRDVVWALLSTGWACAQDLALIWSQTAPDLYDEAAFQVLVDSYKADHGVGHSIGTVIHHARLSGWTE